MFPSTRTVSFRSKIFSFTVLLSVLFIACTIVPNVRADDTGYYRATIESSVNPVTAGYLQRSIRQAENKDAQALLLRLDTPGGLMDSMKEMTDAILNAELPIVVWVGPSGARAASAGVFITYAAHRAAMAEGTRIGAAHPVSGGGQSMDETMEEKVTNDAVAQLRGLAQKRGRNQTLADSFVRESVSLIAGEAHEENVIDFVVNTEMDLLDKLEGQEIRLGADRSITLEAGPVQDIPMNAKENFLNVLVNPNLVYVLFILGLYGFIYEFAEPGLGLGLIAGGICLFLALYGMSVLPLDYTGLGLLFLGISLMVLDIFVPTFGVLTFGGIISFALGSVFLFKTPAFAVSMGLIVGVTAATITAVLIAGYLVLGSFTMPAAIGDDALVGETGTVKETLNPEGIVYVHGEYWTARSEDGSRIDEGRPIEVTEKKDRTLAVKPQNISSKAS
jgi:membrane-bound serine protease (ClpP class)